MKWSRKLNYQRNYWDIAACVNTPFCCRLEHLQKKLCVYVTKLSILSSFITKLAGLLDTYTRECDANNTGLSRTSYLAPRGSLGAFKLVNRTLGK
jgi:hypothetical protein